MMSGNNPASESTLKPISQLSYHLSRLQSNENHNDISSNHGDAFSKSNYKENGYSDDGDVDATITNMCLRLPDVKLGNVANVYDDPRGGKKLPTVNFNQGARRLSLMDFNGTKSDRGETNLKPMVYFNGSSPKSRPLDIFTSRYSQSSDALQNSDWEWTYDVQGTSQNVAHISERLNLSEAKT